VGNCQIGKSGFWFYLQPQLDQAADGFGAIGVVILAPRINLFGQSRRKTLTGSKPCCFLGRPRDFLFTGIDLEKKQAEGKRQLPPRL
jgi:hypothetical protein